MDRLGDVDRLEGAGFDLDWGDDGSGLFMKYLRRGSGYYIDVGASELVCDGKIKLKSVTDTALKLTASYRYDAKPKFDRFHLALPPAAGPWRCTPRSWPSTSSELGSTSSIQPSMPTSFVR